MSDIKKYIPYSEEWKKEMMKWSKADLIDFLRQQLLKIKELENQKPKSKMSNNTTVPSAEEIFEKYRIRISLAYEAGGMGITKHWDYLMTEENFILASNEHTRLHLEAMRDMLMENLSTDKLYLYNKATDYISKIK